MVLAREHGIGCVGLRNTNHWMRGGTYGWQAATKGYAFMCWTNTIPNMPPWGASSCHLGNNPFVLAVPRAPGPVVLDMAMTQFSYGRLTTAAERGEELPVPGGYDAAGILSRDPAAVKEARRLLPIGYWKGAGLSLLLDLLAAMVSGGQTTYQIGQQGDEYDISQMFVAFDVSRSASAEMLGQAVDQVIVDLHSAETEEPGGEVLYPGQRALRTRRKNLAQGIPVAPDVWEQILGL